MSVFKFELGTHNEEIFKKLENKVRINELVKINKKFYRRIRSKNNKYYKTEIKFKEINNEPSLIGTIDSDGDYVYTIAEHNVIFV